MKDLANIKFWLFDLDNTLYNGATKVFDQVDKKMSKFISKKLNVSIDGGSVMIDNAMVTIANIEADNGVVHVINAVLIPENDCNNKISPHTDTESTFEA